VKTRFRAVVGMACGLGAAAVVGLPQAAHAAPNILGTTGFFYTPDGMTLPGGCANVHYHYADGQKLGIFRTGPTPRVVVKTPDVNAVGFGIGVGNRWEINATRVSMGEPRLFVAPDNQVRQAGGVRWLMNTKFQLLRPELPVKVAVGAIDMLGHVTATPYGYVGYDASQTRMRLPSMLQRLRVGAGWAEGIINGPFVNGALPVTPNFELMVEWLDRNLLPNVYTKNQWNVGARFRARKIAGLSLDVGLIDAEHLTAGMSYTYCVRKKRHHGDEETPFDSGKGKGKNGFDTPEQPLPPAAPAAPVAPAPAPK
jgi:hypothetical protein